MSVKCKRCGRELKSKESQERGYGSHCAKLANIENIDVEEKIEEVYEELDGSKEIGGTKCNS